MGKDNHSSQSTAVIHPHIVYWGEQLTDAVNMVATDRPSPKPKKRPVAAGLFLIKFTFGPRCSTILMLPLIHTKQ